MAQNSRCDRRAAELALLYGGWRGREVPPLLGHPPRPPNTRRTLACRFLPASARTSNPRTWSGGFSRPLRTHEPQNLGWRPQPAPAHPQAPEPGVEASAGRCLTIHFPCLEPPLAKFRHERALTRIEHLCYNRSYGPLRPVPGQGSATEERTRKTITGKTIDGTGRFPRNRARQSVWCYPQRRAPDRPVDEECRWLETFTFVKT